jgi:hypothetical protein
MMSKLIVWHSGDIDNDGMGCGLAQAEVMSMDEAESALQQAMKDSDIDMLDRLIADDLEFSGIDGRSLSKADDLRSHRTGETKFERLHEISRRSTPTDGDQTCGSTEVVAEVVNVINGERVSGKLRWHRDWQLIDGRWQVHGGSVSIAS